MVGLGGLEPPASPLSGVRSNHLSYRPLKDEPQNRAKLPGTRFEAAVCEEPGHEWPVLLFATRTLRQATPSREIQVSCVDVLRGELATVVSRKEVIQPHLPIRLPCYDFTPVMNHSVVVVLLAVRLTASGATHSHGVTGGVYKARERIHRDMLIRDY